MKKEENMLLSKIVSVLPDDFQNLKDQLQTGDFIGIYSGSSIPDYKSIIAIYSDTLAKFKKRGENFRISGLKIYSKRNSNFEDIELLVRDNLLAAINIANSQYELSEFDLTRITGRIVKSEFIFPPNEIDVFYNSLDQTIKNILNPDDLFDIEFDNRTYYSFYDMEDGNYIAVDKKLNVYSLVHDAIPMVAKIKMSFFDILNVIKENRFDKEAHLDDRYGNRK